MSNSNIYLLTGPVHSGKTTQLKNWIANQSYVGGFIAEDIDNLRYLRTLNDNQVHPFQKKSKAASDDILVGKYVFSKSGFDIGKNQLLDALNHDFSWFIVDEVGKLEMDNQGFEPALSQCVSYFKKQTDKKILLVIRDNLLDAIIHKYELQGAQIVKKEDLALAPFKQVKALVLAGGASSRMGEDKAFIKYYDKEQIYHTANLLAATGLDTYLSINHKQLPHIDTNYAYILDKYTDCGPLSGIASAFREYSDCHWLVVGCDYPLLQQWDVNHLLFEAKQFNCSSAYFLENEGFYLPTVGIYHPRIVPYLLQALGNQDYAMQKILRNANTIKIKPLNLMRFESANTPLKRDQLKKELNERE